MASFRGGSFDPTNLLWPRATRPPLQQRAQSSSSEASSVSEEQFTLSRGNTPSREYAPSTQARLLPSVTSADSISLARQDANTGDELLYGKRKSRFFPSCSLLRILSLPYLTRVTDVSHLLLASGYFYSRFGAGFVHDVVRLRCGRHAGFSRACLPG